MAKLLSILVVNALFLLLWIVLVSASAEQNSVVAAISPSLEQAASPRDTNICNPNDVYKSEVWGPTQDCNICTYYCAGVCSGMGSKQVKKACTPRRQSWQVFCQCCCSKPPSPPPPPPSSPPPTPSPPPPPPTPTPSGGECQDGDDESETTLITSNCADCTNWCKEECADLGGSVVSDKCAIGESKFVRRCKCCCRKSSCPALGCPADVTWTIPGVSPCKYKLLSSLSSLPSSKLSM